MVRVGARAGRVDGGQAAKPAVEEPEAPGLRSLRRLGDIWEVASGDTSFHLMDAKGVQHLAHLLANPGQEFHALDLVGGQSVGGDSAGLPDQELSVRGRGQDDSGPLLATQAKAEYRQRVSDLQEELEEAETFNDPERASRARAELDFIEAELSAAVGLGGRDRRPGRAPQ